MTDRHFPRLHAFREEKERQHQQRGDRQRPERIEVGKLGRLKLDLPVDDRERAMSGIDGRHSAVLEGVRNAR